ncbi:MAG TPA: PfkB family carbohydrate kinase [Candidatus Eisenbacteria bacterium]|nr:PfkB family carbohydrate kinase [Candidatus Eisenbacteria bacterium]
MTAKRARAATRRRRAVAPQGEPDRDRLLDLARRIGRARVVVLGDVVLDRYWVGRSSRLSREAPVIILEFEEERGVPGGAANAAANVRSLGGRARLVGRAGGDPAGVTLRRVLKSHGLEPRWIVRDAAIDTAVKTRVLAGSSHAARQQLVRLDRGRRVTAGPAAERAIVARLRNALRGADALLLSDYGYGVLGPGVRAAALRQARRAGVPVVVDSRWALRSYRGATLLTPNEHEIAEAFHLPSLDASALRRAGESLRAAAGADAVWITRGSDGMLLLERRVRARRVPVVGGRDVVDTTGAGDAVSAAAALALGVGATQAEAALLATYAASVVVMKRGTATVTRAELEAAIRAHPLPRLRA